MARNESEARMTPDEIDHLLRSFKLHIEECPDFQKSDIAALEEMAKIWKVVQAIREGGGWVIAGLLKLGSVGSAIAVLYMLWRGGK